MHRSFGARDESWFAVRKLSGFFEVESVGVFEEEKKFGEFAKAGVPAAEIATNIGKTLVGAGVRFSDFGLEDDTSARIAQSSSSFVG